MSGRSREEMLNDVIRGRTAKPPPAGAGPAPTGQPGGGQPGAPGAQEAAQPQEVGRASVVVAGATLQVANMAASVSAPEPHERYPLRITVTPASTQGQWAATLAWPAPPTGAAVSLFRVIMADGCAPNSNCDSVEATLGVVDTTTMLDDTATNPAGSASRFYEVWRYSGSSPMDAAARPPYLFAQGHVVWPPLRVSAAVDNGQVVVSWPAFPDRAERYRYLRQVKVGQRLGADDAEVSSLPGFVDRTVEPGGDYEYEIYTETMLAGAEQLSERPAKVRAHIPHLLHPVSDLRVEVRPGQPDIVDLSWTTLASGEIDIYRSDHAPAAGLHELGAMDQESVRSEDLGLQHAIVVRNHPQQAAGRTYLREVAVPPNRAEVYFTPVTRAEGRALVGRTVPLLRPQAPHGAFLEDRVDWVLLVFAWPDGASQVKLFLTARDDHVDPRTGTPTMTISREEHAAFGGMRIGRDLLPPGPITLHLAGYRMYAGAAEHSPPVRLDADLSVVAHYQLEKVRGGRFRGGTKLLLTLWSQVVLSGVDLVLVHRPDGLPLCAADQADVLARLVGVTIQDKRASAKPIDLSELLTKPLPSAGYVRVLVRPGANIALVDPPVAQLRLTGDGK